MSLKEAYDSARRYFLDTHEYATKKKVEIDAIVTELQSLIATQRDLVGAEAVGKFSNAFQEAATSHGSAAKKWLVGALVSAALTAGVAVMLVFLLPIKNDGAGQIAQHVLTRVIVLGLFLTAVFWCGRFYRSNKHLEVVNNHRFNGMRTFLAFTQATKDPATKNAVLLETTRAIYSNVATGYLAKTDGSPESDLRIIELVKSLAQGGGSSTGS